jgi:hypothetical protein
MAATKTIRKSRTFTRSVKGKVVEETNSTKLVKVPAYEPRETDGGKIVTRYRRTVLVRKANGKRVRRTTRRKSVRSKY